MCVCWQAGSSLMMMMMMMMMMMRWWLLTPLWTMMMMWLPLRAMVLLWTPPWTLWMRLWTRQRCETAGMRACTTLRVAVCTHTPRPCHQAESDMGLCECACD
jgi:hypothetical protein